ncbi:MAG: hypothetical protein JXA61_02770 [Bacteroidales bacterium]|nr:hypothetical protein [Bacteroidales bacterium]
MLNENEFIMLILGIGIVFLIYVYRSKIKRIYGWKILLFGFYMLIAAGMCTVAEELILNSFLNVMEHLLYSISSIAVTIWCWKVSSGLWREKTNE